jgi:propanol-preferring alcohol dehydrogenase
MHDFGTGSLPFSPPFTLGHENAGWVESFGEGVSSVREGDAVAVYGPWGCGKCARCLTGAETYCEDPSSSFAPFGGGGLGVDGGMADYMLVPHERLLVRLPSNLSPEAAAPLTDAGLTAYHAVRRSAPKLTPGATAVVIGCGGLGHMAVQLLRATSGAQVVAVDSQQSQVDFAVSLGADEAVLADGGTAAAVRTLTEGKGADVVIDFVGSDDSIAAALGMVRTMGDVTLVGLGGGSHKWGFFSQPYEVSLTTTYWGTRPELVEVIDLAARGVVHAEHTVYRLEDAAQAYEDMRAGHVRGRAVVVP